MGQYQSYKDSGVEWLGQIPSHWKVNRIASYFTERKTKVSDKDYAPLSVAKMGILPQLENVAKTNDGDNRKLVKANDFVINSRSDRRGSSGVSPLNGSVSLINIVLEPRPGINPGYCNYLLKSYAFIEEFYRNGHGIVADLWTTRYDDMKAIKICIPPYHEQERIAVYLDSVTAIIDEAIAQQKQLIDLLDERKKIIIFKAITKGVKTIDVMKDSGIDTIGTIPSHWEVRSLKTIMSIQRGYDLTAEQFINGPFPVYGSGGLMGYHNCMTSTAPSIIIGRSGSVGKLQYITDDFWAHNTTIYLSDTKGNNVRYLYYVLSAIDLQSLATQTAVPTLDRKNVLCYKFPIVIDVNEQELIVSYLDKKIKYIDTEIEHKNNTVRLLQERKQIIINDVVTGKVKVL